MTNTAAPDVPTRDIILRLIAERPGLTDRELGDVTGFITGKVTPARIRLWEAGEIEPTTEAGWRAALKNNVKDVGWQIAEPDCRDAVAERARTRPKRNARTPEARARQMIAWLRNATTYKVTMRMLDDEGLSRRHQNQAEAALRRQEQARRREAKQAEADSRADADMQRKVTQLWDARGLIASVANYLIEERARAARGEQLRVRADRWFTAVPDTYAILKSLGTAWQVLREIGADEAQLPCPVCGAPAPIGEDRHLTTFMPGNGGEHPDVVIEDDDIDDVELVED